MTLNKPIIFVSGLIIGAGSGILATMQYFKKKYSDYADQQIAEMEKYYQCRDKYVMSIEDEAEINPVNDNTDRSSGPLSDEARQEIKEKLIRNHEITTNYAKIYEEKHPDLFKQADQMSQEEIDTNEEADIVEQVNADHEAHKNDPPNIITAEEYDNLPPHIDTQTLYFYHLDETLVDDEDDVIEDPALLIGNTLNDTDFIDSGEPIMFVYNPRLSTAYEIQRVDGGWFDLSYQ